MVETFPLSQGVGKPWGTAVDSSGNVWFAEPGCDFGPVCSPGTPPGQIGQLVPATGAVNLYTLPAIPGNQPIFLAFDPGGNLWFTTPDNDMIGEFSPSSGTFLGQWAVTSGSGPWDLTFANGRIWYTEHLASAVGAFDPLTHAHQDFQTPSSSSNPYGIAADGGLIWFTENNPSVDRVARLDTANGNAIAEFPIVQPLSGTPHMIAIGAGGRPWWAEGFSRTIATLDPASATPGSCGPATGSCNGIARFHVPGPIPCGGQSHVSGVAFDGATGKVWFDDSLSAQVGSFTPPTGAFAMTTLSNCGAHPHDGLTLASPGRIWFNEEFANALGRLTSPDAPPAPTTTPAPTSTSPAPSSAATVAPLSTAAPVIHGTAREALTLGAGRGSWTGDPTGFSYAWQRCGRRCVNIARARSATYRLTASDIGARIRVLVTAGNGAGSGQAASRSVGPVGPSRKRVKAALSRLLAATAGHSTLSGLRRSRGFRSAFRAPSRGRLEVIWRYRGRALATLRRTFHHRGAAKVTVALRPLGRRTLERLNWLRVDVKSLYIPIGTPAVSAVTRFTLSAP